MEKTVKKLLISSIVIVGTMLFANSVSAQLAGLPMSNIISEYTTYSTIFYHFGGDSFGGMFFLSGYVPISGGTNIIINNNSIRCDYKLNGLYYNSLRGASLRPLDTGNLQRLISNDSSYSSMIISNGLYTSCTGTGVRKNEIYGEIRHQRNGSNYTITAGVKLDTNTNGFSNPLTFSGSLLLNSGRVEGLLYDTVGQIGEAGPVPVTSGGNTSIVGGSRGGIMAQCNSFNIVSKTSSGVSLMCLGTNATDYVVSVFESSGGRLVMSSNGSASPYPFNMTLPIGNYVASCTVSLGNNKCNQIAISNLSGEYLAGQIDTNQIINNISITNITPIRHAKLNTSYTSENVSIGGLIGSTLATITKGELLVNGTGVGTSGYVKNGDIINIKLTSSTGYNTTVSSTLFIGGVLRPFLVITDDSNGNSCNLSNTEKLKVAQMFQFIKDGYTSSPNRRVNMLYVLRSMTQDIQAFEYSCSLQYLMDLTENEIDNTDTEDEGMHIAPNCREYPINYNEENTAYTSSKFKNKYSFASRDAVVKYIDSQNPGDCHINIYTNKKFDYVDTDTTHVAPNGKIYTIKEGGDGYYSSPTMFSVKRFDTEEGLLNYIDKQNPPFEIRDHNVDKTRSPIVYAAPNGKEYKIYKTDIGFMSYKLMKVRYYESKDAVIKFIAKNNPK